MSTPFNLANADRTIHVGVILTGGITELLDISPVDLLHGCSHSFLKTLPDGFFPSEFKAQGLDIEFHWVSEKGSAVPMRITSGATINPTNSFETCPPLDISLIGASDLGYEPTEAELAYVRKAYKETAAFITVCGGVDLALRAGVLTGKTATGPRFLLSKLREDAPQVNWLEKRWVHDGKLWTSGALINGLDLMYEFIKQTWQPVEGSMLDFMLKGSSAPIRDIDYKDVPWPL